jgi:hypothetical protein
MQTLRITSETMTPEQKTTVSTIIRSDRQRQFLAEVSASAGGDIGFEFSYGGLDLIMESGFMAAFTTINDNATEFSVVGASHEFTRATGSFVTDGFVVGMWIRTFGFSTPNNGVWQISAVTALAITVTDPLAVMVNFTSASAIQSIQAKSLRNGTTLTSMTLEAQFQDIAQFIQFTGCAVATLTLDIKTGAIVTGKAKMMAKQASPTSATVASVVTAADTSEILTATANAGNVYYNGAALATALKSLTIEINNNLREKPAIGQLYSIGLGLGFCDVTGSFDAYFEDETELLAFVNHTNFTLSFQFTDSAGNVIVFTLFNAYLTKAEPAVSGGNQDVMVNCSYHAILDPVSGYTVGVDYLTATVA